MQFQTMTTFLFIVMSIATAHGLNVNFFQDVNCAGTLERRTNIPCNECVFPLQTLDARSASITDISPTQEWRAYSMRDCAETSLLDERFGSVCSTPSGVAIGSMRVLCLTRNATRSQDAVPLSGEETSDNTNSV